MNRTSLRIAAALRLLTRWYCTATGLLFVVGIVAGGAIAATLHRGIGIGVIAGAVLVVLPYKLARYEHVRLRAGRVTHELGTRVASVEKRVEATDRRTQQVRRDLLGSVATTRDELTLLLRSERMIWTDALTNDTTELRSELTDALDRLEQAERAASDRLGEIDERLVVLDNAMEGLSAQLELDRRQRYLAAARRDADRHPVEGVLLVVCAQRVGSTWLVDLLRHHPAIEIHPTADVCRQLGVTGRRYPAHLSDACRDGLEVEVQDGVGGLVPAISAGPPPIDDDVAGFAIEKVHPSAIGFDADRFVAKVAALRANVGADRVVLVYLVRDPVESMRSFVAYRRRDPAWHVDVPEGHVHDFYRRSYDVIEAVHDHLPGLVVDYDLLRDDPSTAVAGLLVALGLEKTELDARRSAEGAVAATSKADRPKQNRFRSSGTDKPAAAEIELGIGTDDPGRAQASLHRCRDVIRNLMLRSDDSPWTTGAR